MFTKRIMKGHKNAGMLMGPAQNVAALFTAVREITEDVSHECLGDDQCALNVAATK